jgi:hypothetical protein
VEACITEQYMDDSASSPEIEIVNLASVIVEFSNAVQSAKGQTIVEGKKTIGSK